MNIQLAGTILNAITCFFIIFSAFRLRKYHKKIQSEFDYFYERLDFIEGRLDENELDISLEKHENMGLRERIIFLEGASTRTTIRETPISTTRSQSAKEMWKKRKAKQIENG